MLDSKKTWICTSCHTVNSMSNKKCMTCGQKNPNKDVFAQANSVLHTVGGVTNINPPNENWFCPECGRKNNLNFCPVCGTAKSKL